MTSLSISHILDGEDIGRELAHLTEPELERFTRNLVCELKAQDERAAEVFAEAVADQVTKDPE